MAWEIFSIEAWRDNEGWTWNDKWKTDIVLSDAIVARGARAILRELRRVGFLSNRTAGRLALNDYGEDILEVQLRGTGEPIAALLRVDAVDSRSAHERLEALMG